MKKGNIRTSFLWFVTFLLAKLGLGAVYLNLIAALILGTCLNQHF